MCGACQTPAAQVIARVRAFLTFLFIPLLPLGSRYRSTCTMCGAGVSLTRAQAHAAVERARFVRERAHSGSVASGRAA